MGNLYRSPGREDVSAELVRYLFHYDPLTGIFIWKNPPNTHARRKGAIAGSIDKDKGRRRISVDNKLFPASNIAWLYMYGEWPEFELDHRNRDPLDDSIANLRDVPGSLNSANKGMAKANTTGFKGVFKHAQCEGWLAQIGVNGIKYYLGLYPTAELAAGAYRIAAAGLHGAA
jgi:hypothetical protein